MAFTSYLVKEDGDLILQESGDGLFLENTQSVDGAAIASTAVLSVPTAEYALTTATIAAGSVLYSPTVAATGGDQAVTGEFITSTAAVNVPSAAYEIAAAVIASTLTLFSPVAAYEVTGATISTTVTLYSPTVVSDQNITGATIAAGSTLYVLSAAYEVSLPTITGGVDPGTTTTIQFDGTLGNPVSAWTEVAADIGFDDSTFEYGASSTSVLGELVGANNDHGWGLDAIYGYDYTGGIALEVLVKFKVNIMPGSETFVGPLGAYLPDSSGNFTVRKGLFVSIADTLVRVTEFGGWDFDIDGEAPNESTTGPKSAGFASSDTWYIARFRLEGLHVKLKVWKPGSESEPGSWDVDHTLLHTTYGYPIGYTGVQFNPNGDASRYMTVDWFSYTTDDTTVVNPDAVSVTAPTIAYEVSGAAIAAGSTLYAPSATYEVVGAAIGSTLTLHAPTVDQANAQEVGGAFISSTSALTAPTVAVGDVGVTAANIATTAALFSPTAAYEVAGASISSTLTLAAPTVDYAVLAPTIAAGSTLSSPSVAYEITAAAIESTLTLYAPEADQTSTQNVTAAFLSSTLTLYAVTVAPGDVAVTGGTIASGSTLSAPAAAYEIAAPHVPSTLTLSAPSLSVEESVVVAHIASTVQLFAPTAAPGAVTVTSGTITSTTTLSAPSLAAVIEPATISSTSTLFAPETAYAVTTAFLNSFVTLYPLGIFGSGDIEGPFLPSTLTLYAPRVHRINPRVHSPRTASISSPVYTATNELVDHGTHAASRTTIAPRRAGG